MVDDHLVGCHGGAGPYNPAARHGGAVRGVRGGRGGTGRHAGFRCRWRKPWGFESLRPHPASVAVASGRCVIARGAGVRSPDVPHVALTFDDGPDPRWTPAVLAALRAARRDGDVLRARRSASAAIPTLVRAALADGHAVEVHADRHVRHADMTRDAARARPRPRARRPRRRWASAPAHWRTPWGVEADWTRGARGRARPAASSAGRPTRSDWRGDPAADMLAAVLPGPARRRDRARPRRPRAGRAARRLRGDRRARRAARRRRPRARARAGGAAVIDARAPRHGPPDSTPPSRRSPPAPPSATATRPAPSRRTPSTRSPPPARCR